MKKLNLFASMWAVLALFSFSPFTEAGILFEPYGGYATGNLDLTPTGGTAVNSTVTGFGYGGRVGFVLHHFVFLAYEYQGMSGNLKTTGSTTSNTWTQGTSFVTLGFQAPMGFRLFGSYGFSMTGTETETPDALKYTGTAYKLGVGWRLMNELAVNAEYTIYNLNNYTQGTASGAVSSLYDKDSFSATMITLSFPFTFLNHMGGSGGGGGGGSSRPR